ncbi:MAG: helix-turn-helix domain-containing protein [bacterium]|nr:helix-turn-helix domain-containing protein [bacterium]
MDKIYDVFDVADMFSLSELTIRRYLKSNQLKGFKVGRFWRIEKSEVDRFIAEAKEKRNRP